jgi:hypothetical protein
VVTTRRGVGHDDGVSSEPDMLALLTADDPPVPVGGERHHVLLRPSFHPEALLTVDLAPVAAVRMRSFTGGVGRALNVHRTLRLLAEDDGTAGPPEPPALPEHHEARAVLTPARGEQLRSAIARALPGLEAPDDRRGVDGIGLTVEVVAHGAPVRRYRAWSPDCELPQHSYFALLHALASEVLPAEPAQRRLEQLHGYLDLGLSARDRGGHPRCLQVFGRLSSTQEEELTAFFALPSTGEPLVIDMRNFEGMGTLLYPLFRRLSRRPGPIGWAVSPAARRQLGEAGVPTDQLRDDLADAVLRVVGADARR